MERKTEEKKGGSEKKLLSPDWLGEWLTKSRMGGMPKKKQENHKGIKVQYTLSWLLMKEKYSLTHHN